MKYRTLGKTGLKVSVIGVGTWQFGGEWGKDFTQHEVFQILSRARELGLNLFLKLVMRLLSRGARKKAKSLGVRFSFLFMRAQGQQLGEITSLIESGVIRPVVDKVFPFEKTGDALAYVETGRAKGKVVIAVKQ